MCAGWLYSYILDHTHTTPLPQSYVLSLSETNEELPILKDKVKALEEAKKEVEESLQDVTNTLESEREIHTTQAEEMKTDHEERLKVCEELVTEIKAFFTFFWPHQRDLENRFDKPFGVC